MIVLMLLAVLVTLTPAPVASAAGSATTPVWLGAPFTGQYGGTSGRPDTRPGHHPVYVGQWSADLYAPKGTNVRLYVAPKDNSLNSKITAKVLSVSEASCGASKGGYAVKVGIFHSGTQIGWVYYGHLSSVAVSANQTINRWDTKLGVVGWFTRSSCWDVRTSEGAHVHYEAMNVRGTSCYRAVSKGQAFGKTEYVGYIGRNDSGACEAGA